MLPRSRRLSTQDFKDLQSGSKAFQTPYCTLRVRYRGAGSSRFGVVISQKVHKGAVERHRLKRRVVGGIERILPSVNEGADCAIYMKKAAVDAGTEEIQEALTGALKAAKLIK